MNLNTAALRQYLKDFDFKSLFVKELGWDRHDSTLTINVEGKSYSLPAVAQKRGMVAFLCPTDGKMPDYKERRKIEHQVRKSAHEHIIIFTDKEKTLQIWQWVKREPGKPTACREHHFNRNQSGEALIQKLNSIAFTLDEEDLLSLVDVTLRARTGFDVEKVTRKFYDRFKTEHATFLKFLKGIPDEELQRWYASVMINRLMFIYFIQKKGFLNNDRDYLRVKLKESKNRGKDQYYKEFLCPLFFEGFAKEENERSAAMNKLLGLVPYLNGGLFLRHQIEEVHGKTINIADAAFEKVFDFFEQYQWHLDERRTRNDNEINPDILGYIFEKYINQKQMGAYYTREDITEYISKNTIIPFLFDEAKKKCKIAFEGDQSVWKLLQIDPDRYIYDAVRHGVYKTLESSVVPNPLPPEIAAGLNDVSQRTGWNKPASPEYALPTEIWREVVARRKRYEEVRSKLTEGDIRDINDLITYNLNIRQFAQDVVETCEGPDLLNAFWHAIENVTVLDPTCGSGAFLFAALNILEPLYEACLDRMGVFLNEWGEKGKKLHPNYHKLFSGIRARLEQHPNERYFILKSIIINNLYGVDIMEEATEICKLRLFLRLVAQIEDPKHIEPLPDIDFNIRAGNTLVGYVSLDQVKKQLMLHSGSGEGTRAPKDGEVGVVGTFDFDNEVDRKLKQISDAALDIDSLFRLFRQQQTELGGTVTAKDKAKLQEALKKLEDELNRYLATEYGVGTKKGLPMDKWFKSHQPFHWFVDFYGIMSRGGFDVIIGNPPYIELTILTDYKLLGYSTEDSGNLYAQMIERSLRLGSETGRRGFIVPVSSVSTDRYQSLQTLLLGYSLHFSSFDDRPSRLFEGLEHIRLTIHLIGPKNPELISSRYHKWAAVERRTLFDNLIYAKSKISLVEGSFPKLCSQLEASIVDKLLLQSVRLSDSYSRNPKATVFYSRKVGYFIQALNFEPTVLDGQGKRRPPSEFKSVGFDSKEHALVALACLNSSLFYWFITVYSDCRHVNKREVDSLPIDLRSANSSGIGVGLSDLTEKLMKDLKANSEMRKMQFKHDTLTVQCIFPKLSKPIIDEIDRVLAHQYGFTDEELDFIINYDIKYRMGRDAMEEDED